MRKKKYNIGKRILAGVLAAAVALAGGAFPNIKIASAAITQCGSTGDGTAEAGDVAVCYEVVGEEISIVGMQYDSDIDASVAVCDIPNTIEGKPVTTIKTNAFGKVMPFYKLVIPDNVVTVEEGICTWISPNMTISPSLVGAPYLSTIVIGKGLSDINMPIFKGWNMALSSITISDKNKTFEGRDNAVIEKATGKLVLGSQQTKIPDDIKSIGDYAFLVIGYVDGQHASNETFCALNRDENGIFIIPDGVESIGKGAFKIPSEMQPTYATEGPLYNETVFIPNTVKNIGDNAFSVKSLIMYNDSISTSLGLTYFSSAESFGYMPNGIVVGEIQGSSSVTGGSKSAALYIKSKSSVTTTLNGTTTSKITLPTSTEECSDLNWPGHKFLGWYLDKSCNKWPVTEIPKNSRGTVPVYAKWASSHTISYSTAANGGTTTAPSDVTEKEDGTEIVDGDDCSFALSTDNYAASKGNALGTWTHVGWNTDKNAHASGDGENPSLIVDDDELLYAIFKLDIPVQFTDAQGDRNVNATLWNTDTSGTLTFPAIRAKSGWDAVGWTTSTTADAEAVANVKNAGDTIAVTQKGIHYYALYKRTVGIDTDGDGISDESEDEYGTWPRPDNSDEITAPDKPEDKPGYKFDGWVPNPNPDDVPPVQPGEKIKPGDDGIKAVFTPISYSVKFHANNGTVDISVQNFTYDTAADLDANPFTYTGYRFDGWATSAASTTVTYTDGQNVKNLTATENATVDLYAVWVKDGGTASPTPSPTATASPGASASTAPTASPEASASAVPTASPAPTATASPVPSAAAYQINYELDGGTFLAMPETSYTSGKNTMLPAANMVEKKGYAFSGWYDNKYFVGNPVTSIGQANSGDVTVYAKWAQEQETYKINYVLNGGTFTEPAPVSYTAGSATMLPQDSGVSREGYTFAGWYNNGQFTGVPYTFIPSGETGDKVYYAKWAAKAYSVKLHLNGGKLDTDSNFLYGYGEEIALPTPTKENSSFEGWYGTADFSGEAVLKATASDTNKEYYAKWKDSPSGDGQLNPDGSSIADGSTPPVGATLTSGKGIYVVNNGKDGEPSVTYKAVSFTPAALVIPDTITVNGVVYKVTAISPSLVKNKSKLKSVQIGKYVKRIPNGMFAGCRALTKVTGGKGVAVIGKNAFKGCVKLSKVSIFSNKKLKSIGKNAFLNCKKLKRIIIGPKVTKIQSGAFKGCSNLRKVVMKSRKLKAINENTFMGCKKLKSITIRNKVSSIRKNAFKGCKSLKKVNIKSKKLKTVGKNAFKGIHKKCKIKVPASKFSRYKKLLKGKGQKKSVKILK